MAKYADEIADRSGIGEALIGIFLLAGVTSLPEIATSFTAAQSGDAPLAINNLLGSIAMQVAVLAVADLIYGKSALTSIVPNPVVMLQGALNICLLTFVAVAVVVGDFAVFGIGIWSWGLGLGALYSFKKLVDARGRKPWIANLGDDKPGDADERQKEDYGSLSLLIVKTLIAGVTILLAGFFVARSGAALANQTGLGSSFMGVAFVAIATSLPEVSTVFAAMRRGLYTMAISDIFGTNILNVALIVGVDAIAPGPPVLDRVGEFSIIGALLGVAVTGIFLIGIIERRDRTIGRMGVDSAAVLVTYAGGLVLLFSMRHAV